MKKEKFQEKGQALIVIALAAVVLFGFAALAIDGSRVYSDRRNAQNAADTAVMAAALAKIRTSQGVPSLDYITAAKNRATSNNYTNGVNNATVTVNLCSEVTCIGLPPGAIPSEYIIVRIKSIVPMTFGRIIGWTTIPNNVESIAHANPTPPLADWRKAGMVATKSDASNQCYKANGGAQIGIHGSGIFVNCTGSSALFLNSAAGDITMDADAQIVGGPGGCVNKPGWDIGTGEIVCNTPPAVFDASTFASYPTKDATPVCTSPGDISGTSSTPGNINSNVTISGPITLTSGIYCLNGNTNLIGANATISGTGNVTLVFANGKGLSINGGPNTFDGLDIFMNNGNFVLKGSLTANRLRFFGSGNSSFGASAGATLTSGDAYIYSEGGSIDIDAQASTHLTAPTSGTYAGLLMHTPWSNTNPFKLNGGTDDTLTGTILVPHSDVTFNGSEGFKVYGQVIGYTFQVNGSGHSDIYFTGPGDADVIDPTIEFTK